MACRMRRGGGAREKPGGKKTGQRDEPTNYEEGGENSGDGGHGPSTSGEESEKDQQRSAKEGGATMGGTTAGGLWHYGFDKEQTQAWRARGPHMPKELSIDCDEPPGNSLGDESPAFARWCDGHTSLISQVTVGELKALKGMRRKRRAQALEPF